MKQAVSAAGDTVSGQIKASALTIEADSESRQRANKIAARFDKAWKTSTNSLDAVVSYAQAIESITAAGNEGAESARNLANAAGDLIQSFGVDLATGGAAKGFTLAADTAAILYGEVAKVRAARTLQQALARSSPIVSQINTIVLEQVRDARHLFELAIEGEDEELRSKYGPYIALRDKLDERQEFLVTNLQELHQQQSDLAIKAASLTTNSKANPNDTDNAHKLKNTISALDEAKGNVGVLQEEQTALTKVRQGISGKLAKHEEKLSDLRRRQKAGIAVIGATDTVISTWNRAHHDLIKAIRERRPVSLDSLTVAAAEIKVLIQKYREL
jgi:hypothetical protein